MYHMKIAEYNIRCGPLYASAKIAHILFIFAVGVKSTISYKKIPPKTSRRLQKQQIQIL